MAMDVKLRPAQDLPEALRPLYEEYAAMLVAGDPIFADMAAYKPARWQYRK